MSKNNSYENLYIIAGNMEGTQAYRIHLRINGKGKRNRNVESWKCGASQCAMKHL